MPSSGLLISWAMPAARRPTVVSRSAWKSCRSSSRTRASSAARASSPARRRACCTAKRAEEQRERHDREVEGVGRAVAGPHRLGEAHDRPLRLRAREGERARAPTSPRRGPAPPRAPRARRPGSGPRGPGGKRPSTTPCGVDAAGTAAASRSPARPRSRSDAGSTSVSIVTPPASGRAASPYGRRAVRRGRRGVDRGPLVAGRGRRDPQHRARRRAGRRARAGGRRRSARRCGPPRRGCAGRGAARSRRPGAGATPPTGPSPASSSRAIVGEAPRKARSERTSESRPSSAVALAADVEVERAPRLVERALARDADAPEPGEVDRGHGGEGDAGEPAGGGAEGLHGHGRRSHQGQRPSRSSHTPLLHERPAWQGTVVPSQGAPIGAPPVRRPAGRAGDDVALAEARVVDRRRPRCTRAASR